MKTLCSVCGVLLSGSAEDSGPASHGSCRLHELEFYEQGGLLSPVEQAELARLRSEERADLVSLSYAELCLLIGRSPINDVWNWPWRDVEECDCIVESLIGQAWEDLP